MSKKDNNKDQQTYKMVMDPIQGRRYILQNNGQNNRQAENYVIPIPRLADIGLVVDEEAVKAGNDERGYIHVINDKERGTVVYAIENEDGNIITSSTSRGDQMMFTLPDGNTVELDLTQYLQENQERIQQEIAADIAKIQEENNKRAADAAERKDAGKEIQVLSHPRSNHISTSMVLHSVTENYGEYLKKVGGLDDMIRQRGGVIEQSALQEIPNREQFMREYMEFKHTYDNYPYRFPFPASYVAYLCEKNNIPQTDLSSFESIGTLVSFSKEYDQEVIRIPAKDIDEHLQAGHWQEAWEQVANHLSDHLQKGLDIDYDNIDELSGEICRISMNQGYFGLSKAGDEYILAANSEKLRHSSFCYIGRKDALQEYYSNYLEYRAECQKEEQDLVEPKEHEIPAGLILPTERNNNEKIPIPTGINENIEPCLREKANQNIINEMENSVRQSVELPENSQVLTEKLPEKVAIVPAGILYDAEMAEIQRKEMEKENVQIKM